MNNYTLNKFLIFAVGAAIGSLVTWKIVKTKYEQIIQDVIDEYEGMGEAEVEEPDEEDEPDVPVQEAVMAASRFESKPDIRKYAAILANEGYTGNDDEDDEDDDDGVDHYVDVDRIDEDKETIILELVSPEDFGEYGYPTETLYLWNDGVITDEYENIYEDADEYVGLESLNHFGDYEPDAVHVRNHTFGVDYEILKDDRAWSDIHGGTYVIPDKED